MGQNLTLYVKNDPTTLRIFPDLAAEIGFNESIILLQLDFLIKQSNHLIEGKYWTFQSIHDLKKKYFKFWSTSTINRAIKILEAKQLIYIADFNKKKYDKTRWFAINYEGMSKLKNVMIKTEISEPEPQNPEPEKDEKEGGVETRSNQNDTGSNQNDTRSTQNDTTIPETTTEITKKTTTLRTAECNVDQEKQVEQTEQEEKNCKGNEDCKGVILSKQDVENFADCKLYKSLMERKPGYNVYEKDVGDVNKFCDRKFRYKKHYQNFEYRDALRIYELLPDDDPHKIKMTEYIDHEWQKWDFSKTNNEEAVKGRFVIEYIIWHPVYQHFQKCKQSGLLAEDIENVEKRHPKTKKKTGSIWGDIPEGHFE